MGEKFFDAGGEAKKKVNQRYERYYRQARAASDGGMLKLVREQICQPFQGHAFELAKGQVIRYEVMDGPQIIDTLYHVQSRPTEEWACPSAPDTNGEPQSGKTSPSLLKMLTDAPVAGLSSQWTTRTRPYQVCRTCPVPFMPSVLSASSVAAFAAAVSTQWIPHRPLSAMLLPAIVASERLSKCAWAGSPLLW